MNKFFEDGRRMLRRVPYDAQGIIQSYRSEIQTLQERWDLTTDLKTIGRNRAKKEAERRLNRLDFGAKELINQLEDNLVRIVNEAPQLGTAEAVHATGLRERLKAFEGNVQIEALELAKQAAAVGDMARLRALRVVVPDLIASRREQMDPELDRFLRFTTASPRVREAMMSQEELQRGAYRVNMALGLVKNDLANGTYDNPQRPSKFMPLPGYGANEVVAVEPLPGSPGQSGS